MSVQVKAASAAVVCALSAVVLLGHVPARAQDKSFDLKISSWAPRTHPLQKAFENCSASITAASGGTLRFTIFPAEQLGKAFDHYDMARDGIADVTYVSPGYQP